MREFIEWAKALETNNPDWSVLRFEQPVLELKLEELTLGIDHL